MSAVKLPNFNDADITEFRTEFAESDDPLDWLPSEVGFLLSMTDLSNEGFFERFHEASCPDFDIHIPTLKRDLADTARLGCGYEPEERRVLVDLAFNPKVRDRVKIIGDSSFVQNYVAISDDDVYVHIDDRCFPDGVGLPSKILEALTMRQRFRWIKRHFDTIFVFFYA